MCPKQTFQWGSMCTRVPIQDCLLPEGNTIRRSVVQWSQTWQHQQAQILFSLAQMWNSSWGLNYGNFVGGDRSGRKRDFARKVRKKGMLVLKQYYTHIKSGQYVLTNHLVSARGCIMPCDDLQPAILWVTWLVWWICPIRRACDRSAFGQLSVDQQVSKRRCGDSHSRTGGICFEHFDVS